MCLAKLNPYEGLTEFPEEIYGHILEFQPILRWLSVDLAAHFVK